MGRGMKAGKMPKQKQARPSQAAQMAQLQALQDAMAAKQDEINQTETEASAGGGAVTVRVNGEHQIVSVKIKPELCDPEEVEMLQDLIIAAANEAMRQIDDISSNEMNKLTGGLGLPF